MTEQERQVLRDEHKSLSEKVKDGFVNPKDVRRMDEIISLLFTDGADDSIRFKQSKGRGGNKGLNIRRGSSDRRLKY